MNYRLLLLNLSLAIIWVVLLVDAWWEGMELPLLLSKYQLPVIPLPLLVAGMIAIPFGSAAMAFWQRRNLMETLPLVSALMDKWFFEGAYARLTQRVYPTYMAIATSAVFGVVGLWQCVQVGAEVATYAICFGAVIFALCLVVAVLVSRRYPPMLT